MGVGFKFLGRWIWPWSSIEYTLLQCNSGWLQLGCGSCSVARDGQQKGGERQLDIFHCNHSLWACWYVGCIFWNSWWAFSSVGRSAASTLTLCTTLLPGTNDDVDENAIESLGFAAVAESLRAGVPHLLPSESTQSGQQNPRKTSPRRLADQSHSMVEQRLPGEEHAAGHGFQSTTAHWWDVLPRSDFHVTRRSFAGALWISCEWMSAEGSWHVCCAR